MPSADPWPRIHPLVRRRQQRLRMAGVCVLATGIALAMLTYGIGKRDAQPTVVDLLPGTKAVIERQRGLLYGPTIAAGLAWLDYFQRPEGEAALVMAGAALGSVVCFYLAWRLDHDRSSDS